METVSRRDFLVGMGGAGAAAAAMMLAKAPAAVAVEQPAPTETGPYAALGDAPTSLLPVRDVECTCPVGPIAFEDREIAEDEIVAEEECDVLIVGCGIGGLMGALKAASEGANTIVLEKMTAGRASWESVGAYNSKIQQEAGAQVDPAELVDEILRSAYWRTRPEPTLTYVHRSGEVVDFWQEMFDLAGGGYQLTKKDHTPSTNGMKAIDSYLTFKLPEGTSKTWLFGLYVTKELLRAAEKFNNLSIRYETPGVQLIREEGGRVAGCIAKTAEGYVRFKAARGVLLATGGYDANPDMVKAWVRPEDYATSSWWNPSWGTTGDGHMMGLKVGASMDPVPHPVMNFGCGTPDSFANRYVFFPAVNNAILVNREGKRFVNEALTYHCVSNAVNAQPGYGHGCYYLFDAASMAAAFEKVSYTQEVLDDYVQKGWLYVADSLEELEQELEMPSGSLSETVERYNGFIDQSLERDFDFYRYMTGAAKLEGGTWYALATNSVILTTVGGLTINGSAQVLDTNDEVIEGLYATGNASGSFYSGNYPRHIAGSSVGRAVVSGYVAVEDMLKED